MPGSERFVVSEGREIKGVPSVVASGMPGEKNCTMPTLRSTGLAMALAVIDTNILLIANGMHADVSQACVATCIERLAAIQRYGTVVIDDDFHILGEYEHKLGLAPPDGAGALFLQWLLRNMGDRNLVQMVSITPTVNAGFHEFPGTRLQSWFDPSDRKFVAVANAHPFKPTIWQGADCKWLDWWPALQANGIEVEFLCPDDACTFYMNKFPDHPRPTLPDRAHHV